MGRSKHKLRLENRAHQLVIAGLDELITQQGYTAREAIEFIESLPNQMWSALVELEQENKENS